MTVNVMAPHYASAGALHSFLRPAFLANMKSTPYYRVMDRERAISLLRRIEPAVRSFGISALYLFGSTARNEAKPASDVDMFFDRDPSKRFGLIELIGLEDLLRETLGADVDVASRESLHPILRPEIERTAVRVL